MKSFLRHLFIPHEHNNFRARIIHNSGLLVIAVLLFVSFASSLFTKQIRPDILGISYSISQNEMLVYTNQIREQNNLPPLKLNEQLSIAALAKAQNMYEQNYWSHFSPDGKAPWGFIRGAGYKYVYAGENLARGFTSSNDVVNAWMNSPSHRENILSNKFKDVGFAVLDGSLQGEETVLVVEMFGSKTNSSVRVADVKKTDTSEPVEVASSVRSVSDFKPPTSVITNPKIDVGLISRVLVIGIMLILITVFTIDMILVEKKKIPRIVGHNLDHIIVVSLFVGFLFFSLRGGIL